MEGNWTLGKVGLYRSNYFYIHKPYHILEMYLKRTKTHSKGQPKEGEEGRKILKVNL